MGRREVTAAGTITVDRSDSTPKVLLIHRPGYDDWSLPKGKLETDEYVPACAARETWEETAVRVRLGMPVKSLTYGINGGAKTVHWWTATPLEIKRHKADSEVDRVAWLTPKNALKRLTYSDEGPILEEALSLPPTTAFLVVRHAKAMLRKHWSGRDQGRPITSRGRKQSQALIPLLQAYGVSSLASSTSARCMQTFGPYAKAAGLEVRGWSTFSEEIAEGQEPAVHKLMERLVVDAAESGVPTAVCGHRPVLPTMLDALGVAGRPMQTAATVVAHVDGRGEPLAVQWHRPRL